MHGNYSKLYTSNLYPYGLTVVHNSSSWTIIQMLSPRESKTSVVDLYGEKIVHILLKAPNLAQRFRIAKKSSIWVSFDRQYK